MNVLEQMLLGGQATLFTLRQLFRPALWVPWLMLGAVEVAVVVGLWWFAHPLVSWLVAPILNAIAGPNALRYPSVFRLMPGLFARADVVVGMIVGSIAVGASTALFASRFAGAEARPGEGLRTGFRRAVALILANLPLNLLINALPFLVDQWLADRHSSAAVIRLTRYGTLGAAVLLQSFFLYVNALVVIGGRSAWGALAELPEAARRGFGAAIVISLVALLPLLPIQLIARGSSTLVDRGTPEMVGWMVIGQVMLALLTAFILTGSATLVYQTAVAPRPRGSLG